MENGKAILKRDSSALLTLHPTRSLRNRLRFFNDFTKRLKAMLFKYIHKNSHSPSIQFNFVSHRYGKYLWALLNTFSSPVG